MAKIGLYGDVHNDKRRASEIYRSVMKQEFDALFFESNIEYNKRKFVVKAVTNYTHLKQVFNEFGLDLSNFTDNEKTLREPMFKLSEDTIESSIEVLYKTGKLREKHLEDAADLPGRKVFGGRKDYALWSLAQIVKIDFQDDNRLIHRLGYAAREKGSDFKLIDIPDSKLFKLGAKKLDEFPNDPKEVKNLYHEYRHSKSQRKLAPLLKLNKLREQAMSKQILNYYDNNGFGYAAVIVGDKHRKNMAKFLEEEFKIKLARKL